MDAAEAGLVAEEAVDTVGLRAVVLTISTRAAAGVYQDTAGPAVVEALIALGFVVDQARIVPDGPEFTGALAEALAQRPALVITTGGTGLTPHDTTPEQTLEVLDRVIPGIPEAIRAAGIAEGIPAAMLSRGVAGVSGQSIVVNVPGSLRAAQQALAAIGPALRHGVDQVHGGDH